MINIYELEKDLTNVGNDELVSVMGGGSVIGGDLGGPSSLGGTNLNVNVQGSSLLPIPPLTTVSVTTPGNYGGSVNSQGTFGAQVPVSPSTTVQGTYNPFNGNYSAGFTTNLRF